MSRIAERYEILDALGSGGTATVHRAIDHVLDRECAVKLLLDVGQGEAGRQRRERLRTEAVALASLDHPRVVRVFDFGQHEGRSFLAMELLPGGTLSDRVQRRGPLPPAEAIDRMLEVLDALSAAHAAGIVHRDVKPQNVLLRDDGTAALADFGIARRDVRAQTHTGMALGSLDYMAPEQRRDASRVGPAVDLYGAGCTLFHLLTGDTPVDLYLSPDHSPRWEGVPQVLRRVIRRATAAEPTDRYPTAEAMAFALEDGRAPLAEAQAHRRRAAVASPVPTRVEVVDAPRTRDDGDDLAWARPRQGLRPGRGALVNGVVLAAAVALVAWWLPRWLPGPEAPAEAVVVEPLPVPKGLWQGPFDGRHPMRLTLEGPAEAMRGQAVVALGSHEMRMGLEGRFDPITGRLELVSGHGTLEGTVERRGLLTGELAVGRSAPVDFVLVGTLWE